ncbi:MAG: hypothetical protein ACAI38_05395 [Myxococcota bacterium]
MSYRGLLLLLCTIACVPDDGLLEDGDDGPQRAQIECYADGRINAAAARQQPPSALTRIGSCMVLTGGGEPVDALLGTVTCSSSASIVSCTDGANGCSSNGDAFGAPGANVSVSWTGRDVPSGATEATLPPPVTVLAPQAVLTRGTPYLVQWNGGGAAGTVRIVASAPYRGSTAIIECTAPASTGQLTIPGEVTEPLGAGSLSAVVMNAGLERVPAGEFQVDVLVRGTLLGASSFEATVR